MKILSRKRTPVIILRRKIFYHTLPGKIDRKTFRIVIPEHLFWNGNRRCPGGGQTRGLDFRMAVPGVIPVRTIDQPPVQNGAIGIYRNMDAVCPVSI